MPKKHLRCAFGLFVPDAGVRAPGVDLLPKLFLGAFDPRGVLDVAAPDLRLTCLTCAMAPMRLILAQYP